MTIKNNDEDAVVLYHGVIHVLALMSIHSDATLTAVAQRLQVESGRTSDRIDKRALGTLAAIAISYIDEDKLSEEGEARLAVAKLIADGHLFKSKAKRKPDDEVWGKDGRLSPSGDE